MKIVNDGIPELIYKFLTTDFYDHDSSKKTISATTLLKPTREIILAQRHDNEIEMPASQRIWSVFGSGIHAILEKMQSDKHIEREERLYAKVNGFLISGKFDVIMDNQLWDYKVTSVWTLIFDSRVDEWRKQMSIYRYLYFKNKKIELAPKATIVAILRDYAERDKFRIKNYPQAPIVEVPMDLMLFDEVEEMITRKTSELKDSADLPDDKLPLCSDTERWFNPKQKKYNKCAKYCSCYKFCSQCKKDEF